MCYERKIEKEFYCKRSEELNKDIDAIFLQREGTLDYKVDSLTPQVINNLLWNHDLGRLDWNDSKEVSRLYDYAGSYYSENGKRNAKRLGALLARKASVIPEHRKIQEFLKEWAGMFAVDVYEYKISTAIEDFRLLGHTCDTNSCFAQKGRFSWSPIVLWGRFPSFVLFISKDKVIQARAWGIVNTKRDIVVTNIYGRGLSMPITELIDRIIFSYTGYKRSICRLNLGGLYQNGDEIAYTRQDNFGTVSFLPSVSCVGCDTPGDVLCRFCEASAYNGELLECEACHVIYPDYHIMEHFDRLNESHLFCDYGCAGQNIKYCADCGAQVLVSELTEGNCIPCARARGLLE